jgi:isopentenyldiphosphate isomerase
VSFVADELIDIVDENNNPTGVSRMKYEAFREGLWHRASHIWIYNSKGQMLLQLRSKSKKIHANRWDIGAAGHVGASEEPLTTALRETKEELGLDVKPSDFEFIKIVKRPAIGDGIIENEFQYAYLLKFDGNESTLKRQKEEVQEIRFFDLDLLEQELKSKKDLFSDRGEYWFDMIKEVRKRL